MLLWISRVKRYLYSDSKYRPRVEYHPGPGKVYHLSGDKAGFSKLFEPVIKKGYSIGIHPVSLAFHDHGDKLAVPRLAAVTRVFWDTEVYRSCRLSHPHNKNGW